MQVLETPATARPCLQTPAVALRKRSPGPCLSLGHTLSTTCERKGRPPKNKPIIEWMDLKITTLSKRSQTKKTSAYDRILYMKIVENANSGERKQVSACLGTERARRNEFYKGTKKLSGLVGGCVHYLDCSDCLANWTLKYVQFIACSLHFQKAGGKREYCK